MKKTIITITLLTGIQFYSIQSMQPQMGPANQQLLALITQEMNNLLQQNNIENTENITPEQYVEIVNTVERNLRNSDANTVLLIRNAIREDLEQLIPNQNALNNIINTDSYFEAIRLFLAIRKIEFLITYNDPAFIAAIPNNFIPNITAQLNHIRTVQYQNDFDTIQQNYRNLLLYLQNNHAQENWAQEFINFIQQETTSYLNHIEASIYSMG